MGEWPNSNLTSWGYSVYTKGASSPFASINNNLYFTSNYDNNYVGLNATVTPPVNSMNLASWKTFTGQDAQSLNADPLFTSVTNLVPQALSPAIGAGLSCPGIVDDDIAGNPRGISTTIGAYEMVVAPTKTLNLTLHLQGSYNGSGTMRAARDQAGPHWGNDVADHISIELHDATPGNYANIIYTASNVALSTTGLASAFIPAGFSGAYYITVRHRNGLPTVSSTPVSFAGNSINYAFDLPAKASGNKLVALPGGGYGIYGGDINQDGDINGNDMGLTGTSSNSFAFGYLPGDVNGDGTIDSGDMTFVDNNSGNAVVWPASPLGGTNFAISVKNIIQTTDRTLEFDIYLLDTDPAQPFELASVQCGITVNPALYTGGTFSASLVPGTSGLNLAQAPVSVTYTTGTGANLIKLSAVAPGGAGSGTVLSSVGPGTRVTRIKLTSTVPFPANSVGNLAFTLNSVLVPSYATRVAVYQAGVNTQLEVIPGANALSLENPLLNPSFPIAYEVTGGGTCCENSAGLPVGLANSQAGVIYILYRNEVQTGPSITGTGAAINFPGNQLAGTYTVTGTNANGTSLMLNSVLILMTPAPIAQRNLNNITISNRESLCSDALQTIYVAGNGTIFKVEADAVSHMVAGQNIILYPGTTVKSGGYLHAYIANDCLYCQSPKSLVTSGSADSTGITEPASAITGNELFKIYPNPTSGKFTIEMAGRVKSTSVRIELFGMQGKMISKMELTGIDKQTLDLGNYPSGLYFIRVFTGTEERTARILKY